jgi:hypothetical protein
LPADGELPVSNSDQSNAQQPSWAYQGSTSATKE